MALLHLKAALPASGLTQVHQSRLIELVDADLCVAISGFVIGLPAFRDDRGRRVIGLLQRRTRQMFAFACCAWRWR